MPAYNKHKPFQLMLKTSGATCNLACRYCYYLGKKHEEDHSCNSKIINYSLLEKAIREYILENPSNPSFVWHGGEPLLAPLEFYQNVLEIQKKYARNIYVENSIQTNGTLLNDNYCEFFAKNNWLVGISIDGPKDIHDKYRKTADGKPTFEKVMKGIELLKKHGVQWNAMAVISDYCAKYPNRFYEFFKGISCQFIQFTPLVERNLKESSKLASLQDEGVISNYSVRPESWGNFLCDIFDKWIAKDVGEIFIQIFESTLANWLNITPGVCTMSDSCSSSLVLSHNGDIYPCDHFVFPHYKLGNLYEQNFTQLRDNRKIKNFALMKTELLPDECKQCEFYFACKGECPRNRFCKSLSGQPYANYLCGGYKKFFKHASPYMDYLKQEFLARRPLKSVMNFRAGKYRT